MAAPATNRPLFYDRVSENRRKTWLLIASAILVLIPSLFLAGYLITRLIVLFLAYAPGYLIGGTYLWRSWSRGLMSAFAEDPLRLVLVTTSGIAAFLGLLFWAVATSPGSRLLARAGALPVTDSEHQVRRIVENLAIGAGAPQPKLYIIESSAPNAFTVGTRPEHASIAVTKGALRLLDHRELEGLLAHELSHILSHDILLNSVAGTMALFLRSSVMSIVTLGVSRFLAFNIQASVSREREFLADAHAALLTRYPEALVRALAKIGSAGSSIAGSNPAFSHFYFADPETPRYDALRTHPSIQERIRRLVDVQSPEVIVDLERAIHEGKEYKKNHPQEELRAAAPEDEYATLNQGNPAGRVYRVVSRAAVPIYDQPDTQSEVLGHLHPGKLVVAFDDPGPYREVNTADQTFGYISRSVVLLPMPDVVPAEVYDPKTLAALEAALPPLE